MSDERRMLPRSREEYDALISRRQKLCKLARRRAKRYRKPGTYSDEEFFWKQYARLDRALATAMRYRRDREHPMGGGE